MVSAPPPHCGRWKGCTVRGVCGVLTIRCSEQKSELAVRTQQVNRLTNQVSLLSLVAVMFGQSRYGREFHILKY